MRTPFDGLNTFTKLNLSDVFDYWERAVNLATAPLPWRSPPTLRNGVEVEAMLILTAPYRVYLLENCSQFARVMIRDGRLKLVFENGVEEIIIETFGRAQRFYTVKPQESKLSVLWGKVVGPEEGEAPSNVVPFKRPSKR